MKTTGLCMLSVLLALADGGISDALSAAAPPRYQAPVSPSIAASLPSRDTPAGGTVTDPPGGGPRNPNSTPMPAPAPTNHYGGGGKFLRV